MVQSMLRNVARWIISRAANLTPGVVYYADGWPVKINEMLVKVDGRDDDKQSAFSTAAIAMACASHAHLSVGDTLTAKLAGVTRREMEVGDFEVSVRRIA